MEIGNWSPSGVFQVFCSGQIEGAPISSNGQQFFGVRLSGTGVKGWFCEDFLRVVQLGSVRSSGSDSAGLSSDDDSNGDSGEGGEGFGSPDNGHSLDDNLPPSNENLDDLFDPNLDNLFDGLGEQLHQVFETDSFAEMVKQSVTQFLSSKTVVNNTSQKNTTEAKDEAARLDKAAEDNTEDGNAELAFDARVYSEDNNQQPIEASRKQVEEGLQALQDTRVSNRTDVERLVETSGAEAEQPEDEDKVASYEVMFNGKNKRGQLSKPPRFCELLEQLRLSLPEIAECNLLVTYKPRDGDEIFVNTDDDLRVFAGIGKLMLFEVYASEKTPEADNNSTATLSTGLLSEVIVDDKNGEKGINEAREHRGDLISNNRKVIPTEDTAPAPTAATSDISQLHVCFCCLFVHCTCEWPNH